MAFRGITQQPVPACQCVTGSRLGVAARNRACARAALAVTLSAFTALLFNELPITLFCDDAVWHCVYRVSLFLRQISRSAMAGATVATFSLLVEGTDWW